MNAPSAVWMTSGSNTLRGESVPQQSAPCGSTTRSSAHVHGPVGLVDHATPIALSSPRGSGSVLVIVTYSRYRAFAASYSISGAHSPAPGSAYEGRVGNASPT